MTYGVSHTFVRFNNIHILSDLFTVDLIGPFIESKDSFTLSWKVVPRDIHLSQNQFSR